MREIKLTQGKVALVDDADYESLSRRSWYAALDKRGTWYAQAARRKGESGPLILMMHRVVMAATKGTMVDHIDRDGLNNQRKNLRFATASQNQWNTDKTRGASSFQGASKDRKYWTSRIRVNGERIYLGCFATEQAAAEAYMNAKTKFHGEFAPGEK